MAHPGGCGRSSAGFDQERTRLVNPSSGRPRDRPSAPRGPTWRAEMDSTITSTVPRSGSPSGPGGEPSITRLFEMTSELLATISLDGRFTLLNPAWEALLGRSRAELQSRPIHEFVHPDDVERTLALMLDSASRPSHFENFTNRYLHRDGTWRWLLWSARCDGTTWYAAAKDVTDRMWLERQALHDPLTSLPNRVLLLDRARQA